LEVEVDSGGGGGRGEESKLEVEVEEWLLRRAGRGVEVGSRSRRVVGLVLLESRSWESKSKNGC